MEELFVLAHGFQVSELSFHCDREAECQRAGVTAESWGRVEQFMAQCSKQKREL